MSASQIEVAAKWVGNLALNEVSFITLAVNEVQSLRAVQDKVKDLQSELEWMQCFLWDANEKQKNNASVRKWISDIRELAIRAEDVIERYILEVYHSDRRRRTLCLTAFDFMRVFRCLIDTPTVHTIGSDIDSLTARLSKLSLRLQVYGVSLSNVSRQFGSTKKQEYSRTRENAIGIEERIKEVLGNLAEEGKKIAVVHGIGGVGKTTLARSVYNHPDLKNQFQGFAWAYVSQNLQRIIAVFRTVLFQLIPEDRERVRKIPDSELPNQLVNVLKSKKCLVILDDVWSNEQLVELLHGFDIQDDDKFLSKLLVTSRNEKVIPNDRNNVVNYYKTETLNESMSWILFDDIVGVKISGNTGTLKFDLASKMLDHCNGLPLAIRVLGSALAIKETDEEWQSVYDNLSFHLDGDESDGVYDVLAMSYYELPYNLKACFLHLAYFPEGFEIPVEEIYNLWIAEGVVSLPEDQGKRSLDNFAKNCLDELIQKCMVEMEHDYETNISSCRLHDLMRDLCLKIAKEENLLQVVDSQERVINHRTRRLGIYIGGQNDNICKCLPNSSAGEVPQLRSVLFFPMEEVLEQSCEWMNSVSKDYELLRILDCSRLPLTGILPSKVGDLIYVRYLSLVGTRVTELPSSIGNLRSLMVLDLRVSNVIIKVPNVLWKLKSLRKLYFPSRNLSKEEGDMEQGYVVQGDEELCLENLTLLEKLEEVNLDTVEVEGLQRLTRTTNLSATCESKKEVLDVILRSSNIKSLSLKISAQMLVEDPMMLSNCLSLNKLHIDSKNTANIKLDINPEMFPRNLLELGFWYCKLQQDPMAVLARLPELKHLELHLCYDFGTMRGPSNAFPELVYLDLDGLGQLKEVIFGDGACPKLKTVRNWNSPIVKSTLPLLQ